MFFENKYIVFNQMHIKSVLEVYQRSKIGIYSPNFPRNLKYFYLCPSSTKIIVYRISDNSRQCNKYYVYSGRQFSERNNHFNNAEYQG